jgi:hypothetical protein
MGIFSQASKLVSSVLGGSKKGKPEVKSLQLAAVAAKKVCTCISYVYMGAHFLRYSNKRRRTRKLHV